jgi:protein-disulfide isomerase
MTWVATALIVSAVATAGSVVAAKRTAKKGRKQAVQDQINARKAEVFAETEGAGVGNLGKISLAVENEIDEEQELLQAGKSKVRL